MSWITRTFASRAPCVASRSGRQHTASLWTRFEMQTSATREGALLLAVRDLDNRGTRRRPDTTALHVQARTCARKDPRHVYASRTAAAVTAAEPTTAPVWSARATPSAAHTRRRSTETQVARLSGREGQLGQTGVITTRGDTPYIGSGG